MNVPSDRRYSPEHTWAKREDTVVRIGLTDFAQGALGDVVFVALPEVGAHLDLGMLLGEVEATKAVSELYAPVSGRVVERNERLLEAPGQLNADPYGEGWLCVLEPDEGEGTEHLLEADAYGALIEG